MRHGPDRVFVGLNVFRRGVLGRGEARIHGFERVLRVRFEFGRFFAHDLHPPR